MTKEQIIKNLQNSFNVNDWAGVLENSNVELSSLHHYEDLERTAIDFIESQDYTLAIHILKALEDNNSDYYWYDVSMGTLEEITPLEELEDFISYAETFYIEEE